MNFTHGHCNICDGIKPIQVSEIETEPPIGYFAETDFMCTACGNKMTLLKSLEGITE